jgi:GNAT superfamily N-acetyltransferase
MTLFSPFSTHPASTIQKSHRTDINTGDIIFRRRKADDIVFEHKSEPVGEFVLELNDEIVATGGFLLHYNFPFADLFMEVKEDNRRRGLGSLLLQELKKQCYLAERVPAARFDIKNRASKTALIKAHFKIAGFMLLGRVK